MKKVITIFLLTSLFIISTACGKDPAGKSVAKDEEAQKKEEQSVEVDKGLLNVEVTLPKEFVEEENLEDLTAQAKEEGVKEITKNDDGSVTYKMSKSEYKKLMKEMEEETLKYIEETKNSEDFPSIKDITYNKSFSEYTLSVDKEVFESGFDGFAAMGLGITGLYHQVFSGIPAEKAKVTIDVKDVESGEVFNTLVYPDDLEEDSQN